MGLVAMSAVFDAPSHVVLAAFVDIPTWHRTFPKIRGAEVVTRNPTCLEVLVHHREGEVANRLQIRPPDTVWLEERKRRYDATFVNRFVALPDGKTEYQILGDIRLRGRLRVGGPLAGWYARHSLKRFTVEPLREAVESPSARQEWGSGPRVTGEGWL